MWVMGTHFFSNLVNLLSPCVTSRGISKKGAYKHSKFVSPFKAAKSAEQFSGQKSA
jgi:hypothetical protein